MTELERQLTEALTKLSVQSETERRRQSGQVEALRQRVERLSSENDTLRRQIERLDERASDTLARILRDSRRPQTARPTYLIRRPGPDRDQGPSR